MKILVIQHSAADSAATAGEVIDRLGHTVQTVRLDRQDALPDAVDADALLMFGGGISLTSPNRPPWVAQEQSLIRSYVSEGRCVLGICLGSQMLASALGANVRRNAQPEIGWHVCCQGGSRSLRRSNSRLGRGHRSRPNQWRSRLNPTDIARRIAPHAESTSAHTLLQTFPSSDATLGFRCSGSRSLFAMD